MVSIHATPTPQTHRGRENLFEGVRQRSTRINEPTYLLKRSWKKWQAWTTLIKKGYGSSNPRFLNVLMMEVSKTDTINEHLKIMFQDPANSQKQQVFVALQREQQKLFSDKYKAFLKYVKRNDIDFFNFIQRYSAKKRILFPIVNNRVATHKTYSLTWGEKMVTIHPYKATINVKDKAQMVP